MEEKLSNVQTIINTVIYWVPTVKYFQTSYKVNMAVFKALKSAKIDLPFPQREVRLTGQVSGISFQGST